MSDVKELESSSDGFLLGFRLESDSDDRPSCFELRCSDCLELLLECEPWSDPLELLSESCLLGS